MYIGNLTKEELVICKTLMAVADELEAQDSKVFDCHGKSCHNCEFYRGKGSCYFVDLVMSIRGILNGIEVFDYEVL